MTQVEQLQQLHRDLLDGEDLSLATRLVSDVLERRLGRVRRSLRDVAGATAPRTRRTLEQVRSSLDRHQVGIQDRSGRLTALIEEFAEELHDAARRLEDHYPELQDRDS